MSEEFNEEWPQRINVSKIVSYDTEIIYEQILQDNRATVGEIDITLDDIMEVVYELAKDDFSCGFGHSAVIRDLIFQDENGEEY